MAKADIWPMVHSERAALAADLQGLTDEQWQAQSLCAGWSVQSVVAHMTSTAKKTAGSFFTSLIGSGFSFDRMVAKDIAAETAGGTAATLAGFRAVVNATTHPPGPTESWLGETVIHAEDIRRALGMSHHYPIEALTTVADFYKGSNLIIGTKRRIAGVSLRATDTDWSHGSGPEVRGGMLALLMAMTGRTAALVDLSGDGVAVLQGRA